MTAAEPVTGERVSLHRFTVALQRVGVWHRAAGDRVYFRCPLPEHPDHAASGSADWHPPAGERPGKVAFECHGCGRERSGEIVAALGLVWTDLFDDAPARPSSPRASRHQRHPHHQPAPERPVAPVDKSEPPRRVPTRRTTRVFTDAAGVEVVRLHRYDPVGPHAQEGRKGFSWEHRGGPRGGWIKRKHCDPASSWACAACRDGRTPSVVPLYRLPEVTAAVRAGARVWLTEGGKNADDLAAVLPEGEAATTAPDGARGRWSESYTEVLAGAAVTIVADRDEPGYAHAADVAARLSAAGCTVRVVRTPLDVEHADISDHLAAELSLGDLEELPEQTSVGTDDSTEERMYGDTATVSAEAESDDPAGGEVADLEEKRIEKAKGEKKKKLSQSRRLLDLALELYEPILSETNESFLVPREGPRVARPLRGGQRSFSCELAAQFYERTGQVVGHYATTDVLRILQGMAERSTAVPLPTRVARHEGSLVIDLGDDTGRAIVVTEQGWQVVAESPVLFRRTVRTGTLPVPEQGGNLSELWRLVHVRPEDRGLAEAELVHRYFADVSHPLPLLTGEAGTGKTSGAETLTSLIDPSPAPVISLPTDPRDWAVQIGQAYSLVLDNVWNLQQWQSDALCMAVTGGHSQYRQLYTDGGLAQFGGQQCITLTSIDLGSQKADLTTRLLPIELQPFAAGARMPEGELKKAREDSRPRILGALLDRASAVLRMLPHVNELGLDLPRLSDFARVCKALDLLDDGQADRYGDYLKLVSQQAGDIADEDEVAAAVRAMVDTRGPWSGTTGDLHAALNRIQFTRSRYWPDTPVALGKRLSAVVGPLREAGITVKRDRTAGRRIIRLYRAPEPASPAENPEQTDLNTDLRSDGTDTGGTEQDQQGVSLPSVGSGGSEVQPCAVCAGTGPFCGRGEIAETEQPCVLCGEPTHVRSRCGAARHANCHRGGTASESPSPDMPVDGAKNAVAETHVAHKKQTSARQHAHATTRSAPRHGLHLYGVLDEQGLTVIRDRRIGPSEPLEEAYPSTLSGCTDVARRYDLEALWVHSSALPQFGISADTTEPPSGVQGWQVHERGEPDQVELAVPAWLTGTATWAEARTGRELAGALAAYEHAIGMRFRAGPAATALALLGLLHKRTGARRLITPSALPPREVCASERDLSWCRPLTETEESARYVIGLDKHGAYPGVWKSLSLGMGDPEHHPAGAFDSAVPGRHRVTASEPPPDRDPRLPDPLTGVVRDGQWRCTETLRYAAEQGVQFTVAESYVWPDSAKPLAALSERIRTGRTELAARGESEPTADLALAVLKETYAALGGALASRTIGDRETPGALWRPDWTASVTAKARVNILRNLDKHGVRPFAANVDELFFAVNTSDPAEVGLPLGDAFGQYDAKHPAVPMTELVDVIGESVRRQRPTPLLRALDRRES